MLQLDDLHDDCLMEVLDRLSPRQLFKMLRINKRVNRLAAIKIRVKIKAIRLNVYSTLHECHHLHGITQDQVLRCPISEFYYDSNIPNFLNLLTKCSGVKCIDLNTSDDDYPEKLPPRLLLRIIRRCPEIECLKFKSVGQTECGQVLDLIGNKIIHFQKYGRRFAAWERMNLQFLSKSSLLGQIAEKCPNIKQVKWRTDNNLTRGLLSAFKALPKNCWVTISVGQDFDVFEDVFDELDIDKDLNLSLLPRRVHRLSSLSCGTFGPPDGPVRGVEFLGLKKLKFHPSPKNMYFGHLIASSFPVLEEFYFNASSGVTEDQFVGMFRTMPAVKKLNINCYSGYVNPKLPGSASIHQLKTLETIQLIIMRVPDSWESKEFFQQLELYFDEIKSLKKLTFKTDCWWPFDKWETTVIDFVGRMMKKQNRRVEFEAVCRSV